MNYQEALAYIENMGKFGINLGLERIERLCALLGNPERELKVIHVAGTNGKGSTTTFISGILNSQGYKVGIYTSPYIERFTERIKIDDREISEDEVAELIESMRPVISKLLQEGYEHPTEFELITAAAFQYFKQHEVDYVVLEVGLGGRFDATNVVKPIVSVITTISYDHMAVLGNTLFQIAYEKAGIIKQGVPVVVYPQEAEAMNVILQAVESCSSKVYEVGEWKTNILSDTTEGIEFDTEGRHSYKGLKISLLGEHQVMNALTALTAIEALRDLEIEVADTSIYEGLAAAIWPGRFEIFKTKLKAKPIIVLDGGHNEQGVEVLAKACMKYFPGRKLHIVCGIFKDKNYTKMLEGLSSIGTDFIAVQSDNPRALPAVELAELIHQHGCSVEAEENLACAVDKGLKRTKEGEVLLFCGSLHLIGAVRTILADIRV